MIAEADPTRGDGSAVLAILPMRGDRRVAALGQPAIPGINADISRDGRWIAYESMEGGQAQVYVRAFQPLSERRVQVSTNGGREPLWAPNGRELFYLAPDGTLMGVPIEAGTGEPATPKAVIAAGAVLHRGRFSSRPFV